jgi:hypothetical protein
MDQENIQKRIAEISDIYKAKANDLQKAFVILIGFGLFFFFMILFPYFSLKYDATNLSQIGWLTGNISQIISSVDSIANESQAISNNLQVYASARDKYDLDTKNYNTQLNRIQYLTENLSMTAANPVMQNLLQNLEVFSNCIKYTFGTENWRKCNADSKLNNTRTPLDDVFNSQYKLINASKNKIDNTINQTMTLMKNIDGQVERPVDISSYNTIVGNYHNISNSTRSIFNNVNSNLQPINKQSIVYAAPGPDLLRLKQLKNSLQVLLGNIEGIGNEINGGIQKLANRFDQFESPLGKIPLVFSETIAVFPLLLAVGFFIYSFLLQQVMRLRIDLAGQYQSNDPLLVLKVDRYVSFLAPLWIDPLFPKRNQVPQVLVLFIPIVLFFACFYMVTDILFFLDDPRTTSDDLFPNATNINKGTFIILNAFGFGLIIYSYIRLFDP